MLDLSVILDLLYSLDDLLPDEEKEKREKIRRIRLQIERERRERRERQGLEM